MNRDGSGRSSSGGNKSARKQLPSGANVSGMSDSDNDARKVVVKTKTAKPTIPMKRPFSPTNSLSSSGGIGGPLSSAPSAPSSSAPTLYAPLSPGECDRRALSSYKKVRREAELKHGVDWLGRRSAPVPREARPVPNVYGRTTVLLLLEEGEASKRRLQWQKMDQPYSSSGDGSNGSARHVQTVASDPQQDRVRHLRRSTNASSANVPGGSLFFRRRQHQLLAPTGKPNSPSSSSFVLRGRRHAAAAFTYPPRRRLLFRPDDRHRREEEEGVHHARVGGSDPAARRLWYDDSSHPPSSPAEAVEHEGRYYDDAQAIVSDGEDERAGLSALDGALDFLESDFDAFPPRQDGFRATVISVVATAASREARVLGAMASALLQCAGFLLWWIAVAVMAHSFVDRILLMDGSGYDPKSLRSGTTTAKPRPFVHHVAMPWMRTRPPRPNRPSGELFSMNRSIFMSHPLSPILTESFEDYGPLPRSSFAVFSHPARTEDVAPASVTTAGEDAQEPGTSATSEDLAASTAAMTTTAAAAATAATASWWGSPGTLFASQWWRGVRDGQWMCSYTVCTTSSILVDTATDYPAMHGAAVDPPSGKNRNDAAVLLPAAELN